MTTERGREHSLKRILGILLLIDGVRKSQRERTGTKVRKTHFVRQLSHLEAKGASSRGLPRLPGLGLPLADAVGSWMPLCPRAPLQTPTLEGRNVSSFRLKTLTRQELQGECGLRSQGLFARCLLIPGISGFYDGCPGESWGNSPLYPGEAAVLHV